jgi:hypothetical protein
MRLLARAVVPLPLCVARAEPMIQKPGMVLCVCIVVGALAAQPAADDLSGPSTVFVVWVYGVFCWCKRQ